MRFTKYTQETIDKLVSIVARTTYALPSEYLDNLYKVVNLGMYDALREDAKAIKQTEIVMVDKANDILKVLYANIMKDIDDFTNRRIQEKMPYVTQNRFLDVPPSTYGRNETLMILDKSSVDINYIYLTQPLRKKFREKYKTEFYAIEALIIQSELCNQKNNKT